MLQSNNETVVNKHIGPIVLACDDRYAMPLTVTLRSIIEANQPDWPLAFHILTSGVSAHSRKRAENSLPAGAATIHWIEVEVKSFANFSTPSHISSVSFARLQITSLLPQVTGRVLYLDSDILVLQSLRPLWEVDMQGLPLGAVLDDGILAMNERKDPRRAALPGVPHYFNSGMLLIDMDRWRSEQVAEASLEYLRQNPKAPYSDQDALNAVCDGRWKIMEGRWNYQIYRHLAPVMQLDPASRPAVLHFVMSVKPWQYKELHPYAGFYDSFRERTAFARTPREKTLDGLKTAWMRLKRIVRWALPFLPHRHGSG